MTDKDRINILYTRMSTLESTIIELKERISSWDDINFNCVFSRDERCSPQ